MKKLTLLFVFTPLLIQLRAQVIITPNPNTTEVATMLSGPNVTIVNLTINCGANASGLINVEFNPLFYGNGFAMTSGDVNLLRGPNDISSAGLIHDLPGDIDLTALLLDTISDSTFDACIVEFDCIISDDTLLFFYHFGSEEYPEWAGSSVSEGIGVFISGSGINGSFSGNASNFAVIPGTDVPVTINTLNNGAFSSCSGSTTGPCINCEYYNDNCAGTTFQYDGITKLLQGVVPVIMSETYHVKIVVADTKDKIFDSGIIFPQGAFRTTTLDFTGIAEQAKNLFTLYPNPAGSSIQLAVGSGQWAVSIYNTQGQEVLNTPVTRPSSSVPYAIDISIMNSGIYYLTLSNGEQTLSRKFVKQ